RAWAPPRSFDFPTIIAFLEKLGKFAKDYSALSLTYKGGGVFPIRHYLGLLVSMSVMFLIIRPKILGKFGKLLT
ncbi:MAG: hypothetical protein AB8G05_09325, partial [Oligoflexales bacterium]